MSARRAFNLTAHSLAFAKIRAEHPGYSVRKCAELAGYRKAGAAVRGFELLRDDRVIRAILHFSALALAKAAGELSERMSTSCTGEPGGCICRDDGSPINSTWRVFRRRPIDELRAETKALSKHLSKIEKLYETTAPRVL
jgi:hypothetical protein